MYFFLKCFFFNNKEEKMFEKGYILDAWLRNKIWQNTL